MDDAMKEIIEGDYKRLAEELSMALAAVKKDIPPNVLGSNKTMLLTREDYRQLGTSLFIEHNISEREKERAKNKRGGYRGNGQGNGTPKEDGPSTEKQQSYLARLIEEREDASDVVAGFLDANGMTSCEQLRSSQASKLIDQLKTLKKK